MSSQQAPKWIEEEEHSTAAKTHKKISVHEKNCKFFYYVANKTAPNKIFRQIKNSNKNIPNDYLKKSITDYFESCDLAVLGDSKNFVKSKSKDVLVGDINNNLEG